jgi:hypothetical protein
LETIQIGRDDPLDVRDGRTARAPLDRDAACRAVEACRGDPLGMMTLRQVLADADGFALLAPLDDDEVVARVQAALRSGWLFAWSPAVPPHGVALAGGSGAGGGRAGEPSPFFMPRGASRAAPRRPTGRGGTLAFDDSDTPFGTVTTVAAVAAATAAAAATIAVVAADSTLSFYVVQVQDELETPIAGVAVELTTPAGVATLVSDGAGMVRVDQAPPGTGSARVVSSAAELKALLAGRVAGPKRRTPLPNDDRLAVVTPARLDAAPSFPDAVTQRVMLVTRTDLVWGSVAPRWGDLMLLSSDDDAARLAGAAFGSTLQLCACGAGERAVLGLPPNGVDAAEVPDGTPLSLAVDGDALHEALMAADLDAARLVLDAAATDPPSPPPPPDFPAPSAEGALFAANLAALALQGVIDAPFVPEEQV